LSPDDVDLVVGTIAEARDHPGARAPSYLLTIDLGGRGRREAGLPSAGHEREDLVGRQVICALEGDEMRVLGAHSHAQGLVLLGPEREVEDGSVVA
jgi:tRNA-binding EMAP/Myf-like protein